MEEKLKVQRFSDQMLIELEHNSHKGSILNWDNLESLVTELEYHKAKMLLAIRTKKDYWEFKEVNFTKGEISNNYLIRSSSVFGTFGTPNYYIKP